MISREKFIDLISNETDNTQKRVIAEYDIYSRYLNVYGEGSLQGFVNHRLCKLHTNGSERTVASNVKKLFKYLGLDDSEIVYKRIQPKSRVVENKYCTINYLYDMKLLNSIDKFVLIGYFGGLSDDDMLSIRIRDINLYTNKIRIGSSEFKITDKRFSSILADAMFNNVYRKNKSVATKLDDDSIYLIRDETAGRCKPEVLQNIVRRVNDYTGLNLSKESLTKSGVLYSMIMHNSNVNHWESKIVGSWLNSMDLNYNAFEISTVLKKLY